MSLGIFFQEMIILYVIGIIGFIARKKDLLSKHTEETLTQLILTLTLPFLILHSMGQPYQIETGGIYLWLILISAIILLFSILIATFLGRYLRLSIERRSVFEGLIIFGNQGFIGFALVSSIFPEHGALYVSLFNLPYLILIWTYGIYLFVGSKEHIPWKQLFLNPGILATLIGLVLFLSPWAWPTNIAAVFHIVGSTTIPLSMLLIGVLLANIDLKRSLRLLKSKTLWIITGFRLLLIPSLLFLLLLFPLPFPFLATAILVTATPAAPTIALYAQKYGGDTNNAAVGSAWTTMLSIITIPFLYLLLYYLYH